MKIMIILSISFFSLFCFTNRVGVLLNSKIEIVKIDSTKDHYVFTTKDVSNSNSIVLAEKDKMQNCRPFKKYLITDSIKKTSMIKSGKRFDMVDFGGLIVDGITVINKGELARIVNNCDSFSD